MKTLVKLTFGSHLYGTNTPESDYDYKSIFIPDVNHILLGCAPQAISHNRKKDVGEKTKAGETEEDSYSLQKFFAMLAEGNMVALDMLFAPKTATLTEYDTYWREIQANAHRLITRKTAKIVEYVNRQAKVYGMKGSRVAAIRKTHEYLQDLVNNGYGGKSLYLFKKWLSEIAEKTEFVEIKQGTVGGSPTEFLTIIGKQYPLSSQVEYTCKQVKSMLDQYGKRALLAEQNEGIDWKALSHAVRVGNQAVELLRNGTITLPSPDAFYLKHIKAGYIPHKLIMEMIEEQIEQVKRLARDYSKLPDEIDHLWVDEFICRVYGNEVADVIMSGQLVSNPARVYTQDERYAIGNYRESI